MDIRISKSILKGELRAVSSKSDVHRALICAAFSDAPTRISCNLLSEDMEATQNCLTALGARIEYDNKSLKFHVEPIDFSGSDFSPSQSRSKTHIVADCNESGSTARFLIPVFASLGVNAEFIGSGRLPARPMGDINSELRAKGMSIRSDFLPIIMDGKLKPGDYELSGKLSSQFISGMLMAFPLMGGRSRLHIKDGLSSAPYVDMTIDTMRRFGVDILRTDDGFLYEPKCVDDKGYKSPRQYEADGDWSNAAFFLAYNSLSQASLNRQTERESLNDPEDLELSISGLRSNSVQGDRAIADILKHIEDGSLKTLDVSEIPDLVPIVSVAMALSNGEYEIVNAGRLRLKESDRLHAVSENLRLLGADIKELPEGLKIRGCKTKRLCGGVTLQSFNDHRIAMAMSIAALFCEKPVIIEGAECVKKSYPHFFEDMERAGADIERL